MNWRHHLGDCFHLRLPKLSKCYVYYGAASASDVRSHNFHRIPATAKLYFDNTKFFNFVVWQRSFIIFITYVSKMRPFHDFY